MPSQNNVTEQTCFQHPTGVPCREPDGFMTNTLPWIIAAICASLLVILITLNALVLLLLKMRRMCRNEKSKTNEQFQRHCNDESSAYDITGNPSYTFTTEEGVNGMTIVYEEI